MLYDSNYGYPAPDARPALACLPCNAADPAEHEGWTSQCLGSSGTPLACKRGDQVCKGCPPGTYIGEKACPSSGPTCHACCCRRRCLVCACIWLRMCCMCCCPGTAAASSAVVTGAAEQCRRGNRRAWLHETPALQTANHACCQVQLQLALSHSLQRVPSTGLARWARPLSVATAPS